MVIYKNWYYNTHAHALHSHAHAHMHTHTQNMTLPVTAEVQDNAHSWVHHCAVNKAWESQGWKHTPGNIH